MNFSVEGLLSPEEATRLFDGQGSPQGGEPGDDDRRDDEAEVDEQPAEEEEPEGGEGQTVDNDDDGKEDAAAETQGASQDVLYSSIARALKDDDIFHFDDDEIDAVKDDQSLGEMFEREVKQRLDARQRRIDEALDAGLDAGTVGGFERTIATLDAIKPEALSSDDKEAVEMRRNLIASSLARKGYSREKIAKELDKSVKAQTDLDDALDALEDLKRSYHKAYDDRLAEAKKAREMEEAANRRYHEDIRETFLGGGEMKVGDFVVDERTRRKAYDALTKPTHKDERTGQALTDIQYMIRSDAAGFNKMIALWYALTDGGKDFSAFSKGAVRKGRHEAMKELTSRINSTSVNSDGSLRLVGADGGINDILLSDDWKIG